MLWVRGRGESREASRLQIWLTWLIDPFLWKCVWFYLFYSALYCIQDQHGPDPVPVLPQKGPFSAPFLFTPILAVISACGEVLGWWYLLLLLWVLFMVMYFCWYFQRTVTAIYLTSLFTLFSLHIFSLLPDLYSIDKTV